VICFRNVLRASLLTGLVVAIGCVSSRPGPAPVAAAGTVERGVASWYGEPFHGRRTASGEVYDMYDLTAAHRTLPFATVVRVTRRDTGASVVVRINDRGPFIRGRIIDLSYAAGRELGLDIDGVAEVKVEVVRQGNGQRTDPDPGHGVETGCAWVQVGAFARTENAERALSQLQEAGEKAVISQGPGGLSRVRVGPFATRRHADMARQRLRTSWPSATVVGCGG
jgi:rare lipoprotein A